jgi:LuxR family transcriptional regulator, maltose regulon positive regulatory protein
MPGPFLTTKTHIPRSRRSLVCRPRLMTQLSAGLACPLTLIAAPTGFGKTTLLCEWLADNDCRASWLSLDEGDDDPARFWSYVIASLEAISPGIGEDALALLEAPQPMAMEAILTGLINALDALPTDCVLVLDDYHVIENDQIHRALTLLINHLPAQMHVFLTTRADPPLPLARWRARGQLNEIRTADLRFTPDEAVQFLRASMGLNLDADEVAVLEARTEGWVAGLQLAALALRAQDAAGVADFVATTAGNNRFVADYLVDEVLQRQSESVQDFLRQTSILEHLTASLCDRVTGRTDSQAMLEFIERANLFITPTDSERRWYRYHRLFADLLRKLLGQTQPGSVPELHRRASQWYEEHEFMPEAIGHSLAAQDYGRAAPLIESIARSTLRRGEISTLAGWLAALPAEVVLARPMLCAFKARTLIFNGELESVETLLAAAEKQTLAGLTTAEAGALLGQIATMRAMLAAQVADVPGMLAHAGEALRHLPGDRAFLRDLSSWLQGLAYVLSGQEVKDGQPLSEAMSSGHRRGSTLPVLLSTYAFGLLEMTQGRLSLANELYQRALQYLTQRERLPDSAGLVYLGLGELCRARGDLDAATHYLTEGLELVKRRPDHNAPIQGLISLAWVRQARGDELGALTAIEEAECLAQGRTSAGTLVQLRAQRARLALRQGNREAAERWADASNLKEAAPADDLAGHYLYQVIQSTWARLLIAQGRPGEALGLLERLRGQAEKAGWGRITISLGVLTALAQQALGDSEQALQALCKALALGEPEGYIRLFADEGPALARLLAEGTRRGVWREPRLARYAQRLLAACAPQPAPGVSAPGQRRSLGVPDEEPAGLPEGPGQVELLSEREREVLQLLDQGLSNRQIAERLYLGLGTIKTHIHNIYGKLAVPDRQHALMRARQLHLV